MAVKHTQPSKMQALNRKPDLSPRRSMVLDDGTKIEAIGITVRRVMELTNNKSLSESELGMHYTAARMLVNGQPIVYDDLLDCFTEDEIGKISNFINGKEGKEDGEKNEH